MNKFMRLTTLSSCALLIACAAVKNPEVAVVAESGAASVETTPAVAPAVPAEPVPPAEEAVVAEPGDAAAKYSPDLMYQILVGEVAGQRGRLDTAVAAYLDAARASRDPRLAERATHVATYARDEQAALAAAQRWIELAPDNLAAHQALAALYLYKGDEDHALEQAERILALAAKEPDHGFAMITSWLSREPNQGAALALMGRLLEQHPESSEALLAYAQLAVRANQPAEALAKVEQALKLKPDWTDAHILHAQIRIRQGELEPALQEIAQAVGVQPTDVKLRLTYARMLVEARRLDAARAQFEALAQLAPDNPDVLYALGLLALDAKRFDDAGRYLTRLVDVGQHVDEARYYLGRIAEDQERPADARRWYAQVAQGEYYLEAQVRIASALAKEGNLQGARDHLQGLRMQEPDSAARIYLAEGEILNETGKAEEAMTLYNEAILLMPESNELLYARALLAERLNQLALAEQDLRKVVERDPENAHALNALGYTLADRTDRHAEALGYIQRALQLLPDDPAVIDSMGWVHYRMGNHDEAIKYLRRAFELNSDAEIAAHLGEVLWVTGRHDEARAIWAQGLKDDPQNKVLGEVMKRFGS